MVPASMKHIVASVLLLFVLIVARAQGADPLDAQVALTEYYDTFDEAVAQLEKATGMKVSCPADTAEVMRAIWKRDQIPSRTQDESMKARKPAKELFNMVFADLGLTWKLRPSDQTVLIDFAWRASDSRSAVDLFQAIWKPGHESEFSKNEEWWRALDGLLSKEENVALSSRVRQRAFLESMFRPHLPDRILETPLQTLIEVSVVSTSGARYKCLFILRALEMSPGHGWMSYYCFDDRGTLKIADVMDTGHRQIIDHLVVNPRGKDGTEASDVRMVVRHNNNGTPRSVCFVLHDDGLKLVDESGAGRSLLGPAR